jgi:hypothetical protein
LPFGIFWVLALYGLIEIAKTVYYTFVYTNLQSKGIYVIIAVKNEEEKLEGFIRSSLFRMIYGKEDIIKNIIVTDLNSTDDTKKILSKLKLDYEGIRITNWRTCKELMDNVDNN